MKCSLSACKIEDCYADKTNRQAVKATMQNAVQLKHCTGRIVNCNQSLWPFEETNATSSLCRNESVLLVEHNLNFPTHVGKFRLCTEMEVYRKGGVQKCLQTTDMKDIFVRLMGLCPSSVKTAPRKAAARLFAITEQVIYICIFSNVFDTASRLLWTFAFKAASCYLVCNPHMLSFRASSEQAEVWWGEKRREWRGRGKNERENSVHSKPEKAPELQKASMFWPQCWFEP